MRCISFTYGTNPTNVILNLERLVWCKQYGEHINVLLEGDGVSQVFQFSNREKAEEIFKEIINCLKEYEEVDIR